MKLLADNLLISPKELGLNFEEVLRLEIELIERGHLLSYHQLIIDPEAIVQEKLIGFQKIEVSTPNQSPEKEEDAKSILSETQSILSIPKNFMETDPSTSTVTSAQRHYLTGQLPREPYTHYEGEKDMIRPKGKRLPLEFINKKDLIEDGRLLNLSTHDRQLWPSIIDNWAQLVARKFNEINENFTSKDIYSYLETFLGETARAAWEAYKKIFP